MPEKIVRVLECDCKHQPPVEGARFLIDDGRRQVSVILCPEHQTALLDLMKLGVPAPRGAAGRRGHSPKGLSDDRLNGIVRENT